MAIHNQVVERAKGGQVAHCTKGDTQQGMPCPKTFVFCLYPKQFNCLGVVQFQKLIGLSQQAIVRVLALSVVASSMSGQPSSWIPGGR